MTISRREVLLGGVAGLGSVLLGCSGPPGGTPAPASAPDPARAPAPGPARAPGPAGGAEAELAAIENRFGGRLGVCALDTGSGAVVGHRADERFLMCSTAKVPLVSLVLRRGVGDPGLLDRLIRYQRSDLLEYAPVTTRNLATGMTVGQLCEAAITVSDNTAANLLLGVVGGPPSVTAFVRGLGDPLTRFDRTEPTLNETGPGDQRDTTTPTATARDLRALTLGDALPPARRDRLIGWLAATTTGTQQVRAGTPAGWRVGDKTGSGARGESNDIAVLWPPNRAPLLVTVYTAPTDPGNATGKATIAAATRAALGALAPTG
jgi:beta-lactamase class A